MWGTVCEEFAPSKEKVRELYMDKKDYLEDKIKNMLICELKKVREIENEIEQLLLVDGLGVEMKAIRIFEEIQKVKFDSEIFRIIKELK